MLGFYSRIKIIGLFAPIPLEVLGLFFSSNTVNKLDVKVLKSG